MTPTYVVHWSINPIFLQVGPLAVRWYGLFFAAAFMVGYGFMQWVYKREDADPVSLDRLLFYMPLGAVLGARIGHVLFYDPHYYLAHPLAILRIWEGGLASHGGAAGILIALYLLTRRAGSPSYLWLLDRVAIPTALGGAFIRLGNFFNSEIVGTPTSGSWGVVFDRLDRVPRHPVQLYEAAAYAMVFLILLWVYRRRAARRRPGRLVGLFLLLVFSARFVLEFVKMPQAEYEAGFALTVGQLLSIPCILAGIGLIIHTRRSRTP